MIMIKKLLAIVTAITLTASANVEHGDIPFLHKDDSNASCTQCCKVEKQEIEIIRVVCITTHIAQNTQEICTLTKYRRK